MLLLVTMECKARERERKREGCAITVRRGKKVNLVYICEEVSVTYGNGITVMIHIYAVFAVPSLQLHSIHSE